MMQNSHRLDVQVIPACKGKFLRVAQRDVTRSSQVSAREMSRSASLTTEFCQSFRVPRKGLKASLLGVFKTGQFQDRPRHFQFRWIKQDGASIVSIPNFYESERKVGRKMKRSEGITCMKWESSVNWCDNSYDMAREKLPKTVLFFDKKIIFMMTLRWERRKKGKICNE